MTGTFSYLLLIFGQCEGQVCALLVEKETPGLSVEPISGLLGVKASMTAEIADSNCRVPAENMIGGIGFGFFPVALSALDHGRYTIAWGCVGIARACLVVVGIADYANFEPREPGSHVDTAYEPGSGSTIMGFAGATTVPYVPPESKSTSTRQRQASCSQPPPS